MRKNAKKKLLKDTGRDRNAWKIFLRRSQIHPKWKADVIRKTLIMISFEKNKAMWGNLSNTK